MTPNAVKELESALAELKASDTLTFEEFSSEIESDFAVISESTVDIRTDFAAIGGSRPRRMGDFGD